MGLGKTIETIAALDLAGADDATCIVPAIARENWRREFLRWQRRPRAVQVINTVTDAQHLSRGVVITSFTLASVPTVREALLRRGPGVLIVDEGQALKNPHSKRTQAVYGPSGLVTAATRLWVLSGTLLPNHAGEVWAHLAAMRKTKLTYRQWIERVLHREGDALRHDNRRHEPAAHG